MTSKYDFNQKYVLVTGSTLGIGRSIAELFVKTGAQVAIHGRTKEKVSAVVKELNELKRGKAVGVYGDLSDKDAYKSIIEQVEKFGEVDILVNNAGIYGLGSLESETDEAFAKMMQVNVFSVFSLTRHFMPKLLKKKDGRVINISSIAGVVATDFAVGYATTKAALDGLTRNLATYTQGTRVTVNSITVGPVETEGMHTSFSNEVLAQITTVLPSKLYLGRMLTPDEIGKVVLFIASDDGVVVNGASQRADAGYTKQF